MTIQEKVARVIHDKHAKYLERTAASWRVVSQPFKRCPNRATELQIAADILAARRLT